MVTRRDRNLLVFLMIQASLDTAAASAHLAQLAPIWVVSLVSLISGMMSSATGVYVVFTREREIAAR